MIVLDTNVVSELMRARPEPRVIAWLDAQAAIDTAVTAVTVAELRLGIAMMPAGRRRNATAAAVESLIDEFVPRRVLPFDTAATAWYADIVARRSRSGRPIDALDAQIAAICKGRATSLATKNERDFIDLDLDLVNPWRMPS